MYRLKCLDEKDNMLFFCDFEEYPNLFKKSEKVRQINIYHSEEFINSINPHVDIYIPFKEGEDFIVQHLSPYFLKQLNITMEDIAGCLFTQTFSPDFQKNFLKLLQKSYNTDEIISIKLAIYLEDKLYDYIKVNIKKIEDNILVLRENILDKFNAQKYQEHILENSIQAIFNLDVEGKLVYMNNRTKEITGYTLDELNDIGIENIITNFHNYDIKNTDYLTVLKNLNNNKIVLSNSEFQIKTKSNGIIWVDSTSRKLQTDDSLIQTSWVDINNQKIAEKKALELEKNINLIQSVSKISLASMTIKENGEKIYFWDKGVYDIIEREPEERDSYVNIFEEISPDDDTVNFNNLLKEFTEDNPTGVFSFKIKTFEDNIKFITSYLKVIYDDEANVKRRISLLHDVTDVVNKESKALKTKNIVDQLISKGKIALLQWDKTRGHEVSDELFNILEVPPQELSIEFFYKFVAPESQAEFQEEFSKISKGEIEVFHVKLKLITSKNNIKHVNLYVYPSIINGDLISYVGYIQDITSLVQKENELQNMVDDRETLLREIHHRVKNNLQIILSLLRLEEHYKENTSEEIIDITKNRINTMALLHEKTYQSTNVANIDIESFMEEDCKFLVDTYSDGDIDIIFETDVEYPVSSTITSPLMLIFSELCTYMIKNSFDNTIKHKKIFITYSEENDKGILIIEDNGIGLSSDFNIENNDSLSLIIINALVSQIDGEFTLIDCDGTGFKIKFPLVYESDFDY